MGLFGFIILTVIGTGFSAYGLAFSVIAWVMLRKVSEDILVFVSLFFIGCALLWFAHINAPLTIILT